MNVFRGSTAAEGGVNDATASLGSACAPTDARRRERWDGCAGQGGSGIVHDADFVCNSSIIMVNDTASIGGGGDGEPSDAEG